MDWGGTWIRVAIIDRLGKILNNDPNKDFRVYNPATADTNKALATARSLLNLGTEWAKDRNLHVMGIGIALAGPVDAEASVMHGSPHLSALNGVPLKALWERKLRCNVWVGNDANLAALGEFHYGAGRAGLSQALPPHTLVYITVSTGIGGGVVSGGEVFLGAHGLAAEIGHMVIDRSTTAPPCACGSQGCLEALASGTAIARIAGQRLAQETSIISSLAIEEGGEIASETVFRAASRGDPLAQSIVQDAVQALSVGLTNVLHLYNPDLVVLGGGVTEGLKSLDLLPRIRELACAHAMNRKYADFRLLASQLGDASGMVGAAALVWKKLGRPIE
jgi:glucokinase